MKSKPIPAECEWLYYRNIDQVYVKSLIDSAAAAFVQGTAFAHLGVFLGMINPRTIADYRSAVTKRGGNGEVAVEHLHAAHLKAVRVKTELAEGAAVMSRLAFAPAEEQTPEKLPQKPG